MALPYRITPRITPFRVSGSAAGSRSSGVQKITGTPDSRVTSLFDKLISQYQPGGGSDEHELSLLARAKKKSLASSAQHAVSSGLSGTTVPMAEEAKFEEERGDPIRAGIERTRTQMLMQALLNKAGYMERATQPKYLSGGSAGGGGGVTSGSTAPMSQFAGNYQPTQMPTMLPYYQEMAARNQALGTGTQRSTNIGGVGSLTL